MNKKLLIGVIVIVLILALGTSFYIADRKTNYNDSEAQLQIITSDWQKYENEKYGFEFKYPKELNLISHDSDTDKYLNSNSQANNIFITTATEYEINNVGREYGGINITVSDEKSVEPSNIISKKDVYVNGIKGIKYDTNDGMEDTKLEVVIFEKDGKHFNLSEWSSQVKLDMMLSTFKFK